MKEQYLTPYQSQYLAWQLTRQAVSGSMESLATTLVDSQVDLNPHQVDAALFARQNSLSHGVILADETNNLLSSVRLVTKCTLHMSLQQDIAVSRQTLLHATKNQRGLLCL